MKLKISLFRITGILLIIIPLIMLMVKSNMQDEQFLSNIEKKVYKVEYRIDAPANGDLNWLRINVPQLYPYQEIFSEQQHSPGNEYSTWQDGDFKNAVWDINDNNQPVRIKYEFHLSTRPVYFKTDPSFVRDVESIIGQTRPVAGDIAEKEIPLDFRLHNRLVEKLKESGFESRVIAGLDLDKSDIQEPVYWAEILYKDQWIPFDMVRRHKAFLPNSFVRIDYGLSDIVLSGNKQPVAVQVKSKQVPSFSAWESGMVFSFIPGIFANGIGMDVIPMTFMRILLLMPLAGIVVALFRNVIGIKTFGVFLPALLAIAFEHTGLGMGVLVFFIIISVVGLLHYPLERWGLLYTPKLVIMLIAVVITFLFITYVGVRFNLDVFAESAFFPVVILTITAERFARSLNEEGVHDTLHLLFQTLLVTTACYFIFHSEAAGLFFLVYPETLILLIGLSIILGKWVGMRISEFNRFRWILK